MYVCMHAHLSMKENRAKEKPAGKVGKALSF